MRRSFVSGKTGAAYASRFRQPQLLSYGFRKSATTKLKCQAWVGRGLINAGTMSASLRKRPKCYIAAKCRDAPSDMEVEILKEALDLARVKKPTLLSRLPTREDSP